MTDYGDLLGYCFQTDDGPAVVVGESDTPNYVRIQISGKDGVTYSARAAALVREHKKFKEARDALGRDLTGEEYLD